MNPAAATPNAQTAHLAMEFYLRRELLRHRLSLHEMLVGLALLHVTWNWGLKSVVIPKYDMLGTLAGLTARNHVHLALRGLVRKKIVAITVVSGGGMRYAFNEDVETWKIDYRVERAEINATLARIGEVNKLGAADPLTRLAKIMFDDNHPNTLAFRITDIEELASFVASQRDAEVQSPKSKAQSPQVETNWDSDEEVSP